MKHQTFRKPPALGILACAVATTLLVPGQVFADEREDLEKLRATVLGLVDTLVNGGLVPREQADNMMRDAQKKANARLSQVAPAPTTPDGKKIVRVPYIPESVKIQMRDEIKAQVLAETRDSRPLIPGAGALRLEGDLRVRLEAVKLDQSNTAPAVISAGATTVGATRSPDAGNLTASDAFTYNTTEDYSRVRIRARLAAVADVTEDIQAIIGIATGGTNGPTSTNTSLGQGADKTGSYFNRYTVTLDRGSLRYKGDYGLTVIAGRFTNPFMKTDLLFSEDLNMDGVAASIAPALAPGLDGFATVGWFPLSVGSPNVSSSKSMMAMQGGVDWQLGMKDNRIKLAAALYHFNGVEGIKESTLADTARPDYLVRSEYGANYRQRGNTLFALNYAADGRTTPSYGLASSFSELDLNAQVDVVQFDPYHITLNANYVKNLAFDRNDIKNRTGINIIDGKSSGYLLRGQIGTRGVKNLGDWNVSMAYRYLGSDAVIDAFTNSDFGLGGTNTKGFVLGGAYGLAKNTALNIKLMSSSLIDPMVPGTTTVTVPTKFSADLLHVDLVTRF